MNLTVREAATILRRSERAVRAALATGRIAGHKKGGVWRIPSHTLPMDDAARRALDEKANEIRSAVESALPSQAGLPRSRRRRESIVDLEVFVVVRNLLQTVRQSAASDDRGPTDPTQSVEAALLPALEHIADGHAQFDLDDKRAAYVFARQAVAFAAARMLSSPIWNGSGPLPSPLVEWLEVIEVEILPRLGGLLRWTESARSDRKRP